MDKKPSTKVLILFLSILSLILLYLIYHYTSYKLPIGYYIKNILVGIKDLAVFFVFIIAGYSSGTKLLSLFSINFKSFGYRIVISLGLGFTFYSLLALTISFFHILTIPLLWITLILPILYAWKEVIELFKHLITQCSFRFNCINIFIFTIFVFYFVLSLSPPYGVDSFVYQLVIPQEYLAHGGIPASVPNVYCYFPPAMNMLYLYLMGIGSDFLPQLLHYFFFLLITGLIYFNIKDLISDQIAKYSILFFSCEFVVQHGIGKANVDFHLTFYSFASILILIHIFLGKPRPLKKQKNWLILSSIFLGTALLSKYTSYMILTPTEVILLFLVFIYKRISLKDFCLFNIIAFFIFSPLLIRNYIYTGDPLFWYFSNRLQLYNIIPKDVFTASALLSKYGGIFTIKNSFLSFFLIPFYAYFYGEFPSIRFDGFIDPFYMLALFFGIFFIRKYKFLQIVYIYMFVFYCFWYKIPILRYALPIFPFISIITVLCFCNISNWINHEKIRLLFSISLKFIILLFCLLCLGYYVFGIPENRLSLSLNIPTFFRVYPKKEYLKLRIEVITTLVDYIEKNSGTKDKTFMIFESMIYHFKNKKNISTEFFYGSHMALLNLKYKRWKQNPKKFPNPIEWLKKNQFRFVLLNKFRYEWLQSFKFIKKSFLPPNPESAALLKQEWDNFHKNIASKLILKKNIYDYYIIYEVPQNE